MNGKVSTCWGYTRSLNARAAAKGAFIVENTVLNRFQIGGRGSVYTDSLYKVSAYTSIDMKKKLRILFFIIALLILASTLAVYSYGRFAERSMGAPGYVLPIQDDETVLDRALAQQISTHQGQSVLVLLADNLDAFAMRAVTARSAGRSLDLLYYIWHDDLTGQLLDLELLQAADRGVRVRIVLDDLNAHGRNSLLAALDAHPNIEIRMFNPTRRRDNSLMRGVEMLLRAFSVNRRMHNKAWIADGRVAIVGGRNIGDEYFDASQSMNFFDIDLLMVGDAVSEASTIFDRYWNSRAVIPLSALAPADHEALEKLRQLVAQSHDSILALPYVQEVAQTPAIQTLFHGGAAHVRWSNNVHIYADPPEKVFDEQKSAWLINQLAPIWNQTQQNFKIISPYFVPGEAGVAEFKKLRERGAQVDILTNSLAATDVLLSHGGYEPYRKPLLEMGVNLYELKPFGTTEKSLIGSSGASLHTKAFLVDERIGFVGSMNFDPRSVRLNTEMGILFEEPAIASQLQAEFALKTSTQYSFHVVLQNGQVRWLDGANGAPSVWTHEPASRWWQRAIAKVASWLPIESQL